MVEGDCFEREYGCTEADWLRWLPGAVRGQPLTLAAGGARVGVGAGALLLNWSQSAPRRIALITLPRMTVGFRFQGVDEDSRASFMRYFDLFMQRGGG